MHAPFPLHLNPLVPLTSSLVQAWNRVEAAPLVPIDGCPEVKVSRLQGPRRQRLGFGHYDPDSIVGQQNYTTFVNINLGPGTLGWFTDPSGRGQAITALC